MSTEHRIYNLEMKARTKYMRMKNNNDTETVRLRHKFDKLDREILVRLETLFKNTNELSDLRTNCVKTTGWYSDAIRPRQNELKKFEKNWRTKSTQWNYFAGGSIDKWESHPQTVLQKMNVRPQTAHGSLERKKLQNEIAAAESITRPITATGTANSVQQSAANAQRTKGAGVSQYLDSRSQPFVTNTGAHLTRTKSAQFRPFRSPRLESERRRKAKTRSDIHDRLAPTELHKRYDFDEVDNIETQISRYESRSDNEDDRESVFGDTQPCTSFSKVTFPVKHKTPSQVSQSKDVRPKSVSFQNQKKTLISRSTSSTSHKSRLKSSKASSSFFQDSDSEEEKTPDFSHIVFQPKQEWKMPKFYVRPEDRHRSEDMFLMRRHALLQRQIQQGVQPQAITKNTKLKLKSTFSAVARQNYMNSLMNDNAVKVDKDKKIEHKYDMQEKVDKFLNSIDGFLVKRNKSKF